MEHSLHILLYRAFHAQRNYLRPSLQELGLGLSLIHISAYLKGYSSEWIARELSKNGPAPLHGGQKWHQQTIRKILTNEKYIGDALCQKTYTTNTFPYRRKDNHCLLYTSQNRMVQHASSFLTPDWQKQF